MLKNGYITLQDFKEFITSQGMATDAVDDGVMEKLIMAASRAFDEFTGREFYPRIETVALDVPHDNELWFPADLLSVLSLTNGDGTAISSDDYQLLPPNTEPHYALKLKSASGLQFLQDAEGNSEGAISLRAEWGYHPRYSLHAWPQTTTLNGAINNSVTSVVVTSASDLQAGHIIAIGDEIMLISSISSNTLTVARGWNGSTAASHSNGSTVLLWQVYEPVAQAVREIAHDAYQKRSGQTGQGAATITAAGVVIRPAGFPQGAMDVAQQLQRIV